MNIISDHRKIRYVLDLEAIAIALCEDPKRRIRIAQDFGFLDTDSRNQFVDYFIKALDQTSADDPLVKTNSGADVFRAAVRSLGSNSRTWTSFCRREPELRLRLKNYDPHEVMTEVRCGRLPIDSIREFFPGTTGTADARAVLAWAERLCKRDFDSEIRNVAGAIMQRYETDHCRPLSRTQLMPVLVAFMANPPNQWPGASLLSGDIARLSPRDFKLPGMGPALGSEFMRNLGWSGFKPDRHVMRLLNHWVPSVIEEAKPVAQALVKYIGRSDRLTVEFLSYSLAGQAVTPDSIPYSRADNLLWALGAYVEKKGRESTRQYVKII